MSNDLACVFAWVCAAATLALTALLWPTDYLMNWPSWQVAWARSRGKSDEEIERAYSGWVQGSGFLLLLCCFAVLGMMVSAGLVDPLLCGGVWLVIGTTLGLLKYATERPDSKLAGMIEVAGNNLVALDDNPPPPHTIYDDRRNWIHWAFLLALVGLPIIISIGMLVYLVKLGYWIVLCPIVAVALFLLLAWQGLSLSDS